MLLFPFPWISSVANRLILCLLYLQQLKCCRQHYFLAMIPQLKMFAIHLDSSIVDRICLPAYLPSICKLHKVTFTLTFVISLYHDDLATCPNYTILLSHDRITHCLIKYSVIPDTKYSLCKPAFEIQYWSIFNYSLLDPNV